MTQNKNIGDLLIVGFDGVEPTAGVLERIRAGRAGGIILFDRNIADADQLGSLTASLQQARAEDHDTPLVIAIDQEGGSVARLRAPWPEHPGNMALGATDAPELAEQTGLAIGAMLHSLGITVNFAPVLDLASHRDNPGIGVRSFGADPERVAALGTAFIRGMQRTGIAACAKHFPGMGDATLDAHDVLPIIRTPLAELQSKHMAPFVDAIEAGVATLMLAHCVYPQLDKLSRLPATVNRRLIQQMIRREFGFEGAIIADCLEMRALTSVLSPETAGQNAIMAGVDQLLVCHTPAVQDAVYEALVDASDRGLLADIVLDEALARSAALRAFGEGGQEESAGAEGVGEAAALQAVTVSRAELLPDIAGKHVTILVADALRQTDAEGDAQDRTSVLAEVLTSSGCTVVQRRLSDAGLTAETDVTVILTANAHLREAHAGEVKEAIAAVSGPVVIGALRNPYDADLYPDHPVLLTYSDTPPAMRALGRVLVGQATPSGRIPVPLESIA